MIIDLTHPLQGEITVYPGTPKPIFDPIHTVKKDGFAELNMTMTTHTGTHIDAPAHILANTKTLDQFNLQKFIGSGVALNCTHVKEITRAFLKEKEHAIKHTEFILFYTGWQHKWNTKRYFDVFPTLTPEATQWLTTCDLKAVGFDTISPDKITDKALPNHKALLKKEILIIENLTNLDQLIEKPFEFNCIPLKIKKSDGSPVRAFAKIEA